MDKQVTEVDEDRRAPNGRARDPLLTEPTGYLTDLTTRDVANVARLAKAGKTLTVGVWVELPPGARFRYEGITRLIGFYIEGAAGLPVKFKFYAPSWQAEEVQKFIEELAPKARSLVELVTPRSKPPLPVRFAEGRQRHVRELRRQLHRLQDGDQSDVHDINEGAPSLFKLVMGVLTRRRLDQREMSAKQVEKAITREETRARRALGARILTWLYQREHAALLRMARADTAVDIWLSPSPGFRILRHVEKPVFTFFPDFVPFDYPQGFNKTDVDSGFARFHKLVHRADRAIVFLDHIGIKHLHDGFGYPRERILLLRHGPVEYGTVLGLDARDPYPTRQSRKRAADLLRQHAAENLWRYKRGRVLEMFIDRMAAKASYENWDYVFVSTQYRPYKNVLEVLEAVRLINKRTQERRKRRDEMSGENASRSYLVQDRPVRVVLSAHLDLDEKSPLSDYINEHDMSRIVLSLPGMAPEVHAAAYHCAFVSVHPALFEGGIPFTMGECLSVGTPYLVARGAYSTEPVRLPTGEEIRIPDHMLYTAGDAERLADKLEYIMRNREDIFRLQHEFLQKWRTRPWSLNVTSLISEMIDVVEHGPDPELRHMNGANGIQS